MRSLCPLECSHLITFLAVLFEGGGMVEGSVTVNTDVSLPFVSREAVPLMVVEAKICVKFLITNVTSHQRHAVFVELHVSEEGVVVLEVLLGALFTLPALLGFLVNSFMTLQLTLVIEHEITHGTGQGLLGFVSSEVGGEPHPVL